MAAEARRAPRLVREQTIALSVHPRLSASSPSDAIDQLMLRLERIRAAFGVATDLLSVIQKLDQPYGDLDKAWLLVMLGNEDLGGFLNSLEAVHDALVEEAVA